MQAIVIGAGFGGICTAIRLQAKGIQTCLVDKLDKPGGRAYVFEQDGFVFDGGPTIITAPWLIHELFELGGKKTEDYVKIIPLDPFYNVRFEDGTVFRYNGQEDQILDQIRKLSPRDEKGYLAFIEFAKKVFKTGFDLIDKPFLTIADMLKVAPDLVKLQSNRSVYSIVQQYIKDDRLRQVFSFHPLLVGGNPFQTTSIYALIHVLEKQWGVWFAMGGTGELVKALVRYFQDLGGELRLNTEISTIEVDEGRRVATGVRLASGEVLPADVVVSNADVANTYMKMLPASVRTKNTNHRMKSMRYSMSLFVLYFGTDIRYDQMAHHEILMGPRYKGLVNEIFNDHLLPADFSLYLHRPSATDPSLAPPGCDSWYVLSPVTHLAGKVDWTVQAKEYRDRIVQYLERRYMPGLSKHIVSERFIDPLYFRDTLNSHLGSAFSVEPILTQSAWFRPQNRSEDISNLYIVGAGTHPGAGLPGVMSSAKIASSLICDSL